MIIDILKIDEYDNISYPTEGGVNISFSFPAQFWVIDRASSPAIILVGPFSCIEQARACANRIESEYQKLIGKEGKLAAFKVFLVKENLERERDIVCERLESYEPAERPQKKVVLDPLKPTI